MTVNWDKYLCTYGHGLAWDLHTIYLLQIFKDQQTLTGCCNDHGTFPGSDPSVRVKHFKDTLPFTEKTHISLAPTCFPRMVYIAALSAISKKGKRNRPGSYRAASLNSVPENITQPVILGCISKQKNWNLSPSSQWGFTRHKWHSENLSASYGKITMGRPVDVIYLSVRKAFDSISHSIFIWQLWN